MRDVSLDHRRAYFEGARAAYESSVTSMSAADKTALEEWLVDLERWIDGPAPRAPHQWLDELQVSDSS